MAQDLDGTNNQAAVTVGAPPPMSIGLSWLPVRGPAVAGYRIYRAEVGGTLASVGRSSSSFFVDDDVQRSKQYQYAVSTVTVDGIESVPGAPIIVSMPGKVYLPLVVKL